jgi:hypothetical protein
MLVFITHILVLCCIHLRFFGVVQITADHVLISQQWYYFTQGEILNNLLFFRAHVRCRFTVMLRRKQLPEGYSAQKYLSYFSLISLNITKREKKHNSYRMYLEKQDSALKPITTDQPTTSVFQRFLFIVFPFFSFLILSGNHLSFL